MLTVAAGAMLALGIGSASAQTTLNLSGWVPPAHPLNAGMMVPWAERVKAATNGRVDFTLLPKAVAAPPATFDAVRDGLADVSYTVHGYTPGRFVLSKAVEFPFLGDDATSISVAYQRIYERYMAEKNEHDGVVVLAVYTHGPGQIWNKVRPIAKVEDLSGLKIRVGGGVVNDVTKALGVESILKPASQSFELLNTGVVDGVFFPKESVASFKLEGLIKYGTIIPGGLYNTSFVMMMNKDTFAALSAEDQKIIMDLSGEALARANGEAWDAADQKGIEVMQANNAEIITADAAMVAEVTARTKALEEGWYAEAKAMGVDGAALMEAFRAEIKKVATGG
jgi:TRAP-type C4-dicarboxylate transport system substrate-binding protein